MFHTPYQTTACSSYQDVKSIQSALTRAFIHNDLAPAVSPKGGVIKGVYVVPPYVKDIKSFTMPMDFDTPEGKAVAVDVRGLTKATGESTFKIIAGAEYEGAVLRAALTLAWIEGAANDMRRWNEISARVFIRLLCETIVRRLNLPPSDQQAVYVACGLFYYSNFIDYSDRDGSLDPEEKEKIAVAVARLTRISPQIVSDMLDTDLPAVTDLDSFADALRVLVKNPRLEQVNSAFIITLMGGFWYGGNARQIMAVALEYPPVWMALIYQALTDRNFQGSQLTKMVDTENRSNSGAQFIRDIGSYLEINHDE